MAEEIRNKMFVFEDIQFIDDKNMQKVLPILNTKLLAMALKSMDEGFKEKIFRNLSSRSKNILIEEIDFLGSVKVSEVNESRKEIIRILRILEGEGKIVLEKKQSHEDYID